MIILRTKLILTILLTILCLSAFLIVVKNANSIYSFLRSLYKDEVLLKWISIFLSFFTILFALTLNVALEHFRRPRFKIDSGIREPWQTQTKVKDGNEDIIQIHLRLRVSNVGRSCEKSAEVRIEKIYKLPSQNGSKRIPIDNHDPRSLKWVGRDTKPISMNAGIFDFVDLGVRRADILDRFRLEFEARGHYDLVMDNEEISGFLIAGTVYGEKAIPKYFQFKITWNPMSDFGPLEIKNYENFRFYFQKQIG
jgi:hypothetical protein